MSVQDQAISIERLAGGLLALRAVVGVLLHATDTSPGTATHERLVSLRYDALDEESTELDTGFNYTLRELLAEVGH